MEVCAPPTSVGKTRKSIAQKKADKKLRNRLAAQVGAIGNSRDITQIGKAIEKKVANLSAFYEAPAGKKQEWWEKRKKPRAERMKIKNLRKKIKKKNSRINSLGKEDESDVEMDDGQAKCSDIRVENDESDELETVPVENVEDGSNSIPQIKIHRAENGDDDLEVVASESVEKLSTQGSGSLEELTKQMAILNKITGASPSTSKNGSSEANASGVTEDIATPEKSGKQKCLTSTSSAIGSKVSGKVAAAKSVAKAADKVVKKKIVKNDSRRDSKSLGDHVKISDLKKKKQLAKSKSIDGNVDEEKDTARVLEHTFEVDSADHAETPLKAYQDVIPTLKTLAKRLGKDPKDLLIYDPYYCDGGVKRRLAKLGFENCFNENKDFYAEVANDTFPDFDILVTNPPYSGSHVEKLVTFCRALGKPALLLMPNYCYMQFYYATEWKDDGHGTQVPSGELDKCMFLCPDARYVYEPPKASNIKDASGNVRTRQTKKTSPFPTMWYMMNVKSKRACFWWDLPNECRSRDPADPYLQYGVKKTELKDGRKLCKLCGQVIGMCKHTKGKKP